MADLEAMVKIPGAHGPTRTNFAEFDRNPATCAESAQVFPKLPSAGMVWFLQTLKK